MVDFNFTKPTFFIEENGLPAGALESEEPHEVEHEISSSSQHESKQSLQNEAVPMSKPPTARIQQSNQSNVDGLYSDGILIFVRLS